MSVNSSFLIVENTILEIQHLVQAQDYTVYVDKVRDVNAA